MGHWRDHIRGIRPAGSTTLILNYVVALPPDLTLPTPVALLVIGIGVLIGFGAGLAVEYINLRNRERALARGRRLLARQHQNHSSPDLIRENRRAAE